MFPHKTFLFVCTTLLPCVTPQTFFHTSHGVGGSFTSVNIGAHQTQTYASPQPATYAAPQPKAYAAPQPKAYIAPQPKAYVAPQPKAYVAPQPKAYVAPQPKAYIAPQTKAYVAPQPRVYHSQPHSYPVAKAHSPAGAYGEKCSVDYVDKVAEVCLPSFKADCSREKESRPGLIIKQEKECHPVTRTICYEREEVEENEICAYSFHQVPVDTEVKLADVRWDKTCTDEAICVNPHHVATGYGAPTKCVEEYRHVCHLKPVLFPLYKKVTVKLPQPVETCIVKTVRLPRIECDQVREKRCMASPVAEERKGVKLHTCEVEVDEPNCQETVLQLPRQACVGKILKVRTVYSVEETVSYAG